MVTNASGFVTAVVEKVVVVPVPSLSANITLPQSKSTMLV